jgi:hypothetical protein
MPHSLLLACPKCSRHIRATERACPFCQSAPPPSFGAALAAPSPQRRLSRAALAFGASTLTVATLSCGGVGGGKIDDEAGVADDANASDATHDEHCQSAALYGGFPGEHCLEEPDATTPDGSPDAGAEDGANPNPPSDAGLPPNYCDVISHAAYGAPPPECQ